MKRILVPLDASYNAAQIIPHVIHLARVTEATVHLLHVWEFEEHLFHNQSEQMRDYLLKVKRQFRREGIDAVADLQYGSPAERIPQIAEQHEVSLIAMVTHGYSGFQRWALGSITDKVIQTSHIPVFVVRNDDEPVIDTPHIQRILVPLDGSELARAGLDYAIMLATKCKAHLHLLRVVEPRSVPIPVVEDDNTSLGEYRDYALADLCRQAAKELTALSIGQPDGALTFSTHVCVGYPAEKIVGEAIWQSSDLIVMATHGYGGMRRWALGSVADKVLHATTIPLLLVPMRRVSTQPAVSADDRVLMSELF